MQAGKVTFSIQLYLCLLLTKTPLQVVRWVRVFLCKLHLYLFVAQYMYNENATVARTILFCVNKW